MSRGTMGFSQILPPRKLSPPKAEGARRSRVGVCTEGAWKSHFARARGNREQPAWTVTIRDKDLPSLWNKVEDGVNADH